MPKLQINVTEERRNLIMSKEFTFDTFMNQAAANGWTDPQDREFLKIIYDQFDQYKNNFNNGKSKSTRNTSMDMVSYFMDTKLSEETPYTSRSNVLGDLRKSGYCTYGSAMDKIFIDYLHSSNQANKRGHESFGTNKQKFINEAFEENKYFKLLTEDGDIELMELCYDAIFDKNGNYKGNIEKAIQNAIFSNTKDSEYANRKKFFGELHEEISKVPEAERSDAQKQALEKLDYQLKHGIDFIEQRDQWAKMAFDKGYMNSPEPLLKAFFEASKDLDENHPFRKILKELEDGKVSEYPDITSKDCPYIVMNIIIEHARAELAKLPDTPQKANLLSQIEDYLSPGFTNNVRNELSDYPIISRMKSFTSEESKANIKAIRDTLLASKNASGNGETDEFKDMISSMDKFLSTDFSVGLGSLAGKYAVEVIGQMEDHIIGYAISEKTNPFNELVPLSIDALKDVNKEKAKVLKAEVCKNILDELDSQKKSWYDRTDTAQYTAFRNAVETMSKVTDENSQEYKQAVEDLKKFSKAYIDAKDLSKTATQDAGEVRKKMAVLAYSLVEPEQARIMVNEANKVRKGKNKINLKELEQKADAGSHISSEVEAATAEAKKYVENSKKERNDLMVKRNNERVDKLHEVVEADKIHDQRITEKSEAIKKAKKERIGKIKAEADAKHNPNASKAPHKK